MTADHYARSGPRWALGAELVYGPIAAELVAMTEPGQLVRYRLGRPVLAGWLDEIGPVRAAAFAAATEQAVRDDMRPYRPLVVFLSARVPA
jgi:hypothetical protein